MGGLGGEKDRWSESIKKYEAAILNLTGDSLLASAFVSYAGPFNSEYRQDLVNVTWMKEVRKLQIPVTRSFTANEFLAEPTEIRDWQLQGLPGDDFRCSSCARAGARVPSRHMMCVWGCVESNDPGNNQHILNTPIIGRR